MKEGLDNLKHIVVLMMENRWFNHMLGALKKPYPKINGLTGNESNPDSNGAIVKVQPHEESQRNPDPDQPLSISLIADEGKVALTRGGLGCKSLVTQFRRWIDAARRGTAVCVGWQRRYAHNCEREHKLGGRIYTAIPLLRFILTSAQSGSRSQSQGVLYGEKHSNLLRWHG